MRTSLMLWVALVGTSLFASAAQAQFAAVVSDTAVETNTGVISTNTGLISSKMVTSVQADRQQATLDDQLNQLRQTTGTSETFAARDSASIENAMPATTDLPQQMNGTSTGSSDYAVTLYEANKTKLTGTTADTLNHSVRAASNMGALGLSNFDAVAKSAQSMDDIDSAVEQTQTVMDAVKLQGKISAEQLRAMRIGIQTGNLVALTLATAELNRLNEKIAMYEEHDTTASSLTAGP